MDEKPAGVFGENLKESAQREGEEKQNEKKEKERVGKDKNRYLLKRIKTFNLNGYLKTNSFKRIDRKSRRFSS